MATQTLPTTADSSPKRWRNIGAAGLVLGATAIAYLPALRAGFIWNDSDYVTARALQSLHGLRRIWFELGATEQYYPLLHTSFWLQHRVFGDNPAGYHIVNLMLHLGAVGLLAMALRRILAARSDRTISSATPSMDDFTVAAWLGAAFFALHPVHVASVAWITEQKNTFSLVFYLGAFLAYWRFDETRRPRHYIAALALFCVSMLGKTSTVTLPAALLVVFWWQRGRLEWRRDVQPLLPWILLGAAAGIFTSWIERTHLGGPGVGATGAEFELSPVGHLVLAARILSFYAGSLVWPFNLNFVYPRWTIDGAPGAQWLFPLAVAAVLAGLWLNRKRDRTPLAVCLLFAGTLFPVLGFVKLYGAHYSWVWDHWQYLADLAPLAAGGAALGRAGTWAGTRFRQAGPVLGVVLCVVFGILTWRRCGNFHDNETLYRTTLARNPDSWMARGNLAMIVMNKPDGLPEAQSLLDTALRLKPDSEELHDQAGTVLLRIPGRQAEAVAEYETAVRLNPTFTAAHINLGVALLDFRDRLPEAVEHFQTAVRLKPDYAYAHHMLARALARIPGRQLEAIAEYEAALRLDPDMPDAHSNLAIALAGIPGRLEEAIAHFETAVRLAPDSASAHFNLGFALTRMPGRNAESLAQFEAALRIKPDHAAARQWVERLRAERP